ncbi:VTT domain-containing protein [Paucilactobacillus sp. N302-9]
MMQLFYYLTHLQEIILPLFNWLGGWSYAILFILIFAETGLVIFPWLPGESLIFVTSTLAAVNHSNLNIFLLIFTFFFAAFLGDTLNFKIGHFVLKWSFFQRHFAGPNLEKAELFFERHGIKAVIFGRFVPLIRTFVPLIAGTSRFKSSRFLIANILGVALWVFVGSSLGFFFGTLPVVQNHLSIIILGIALVAITPAAIISLIKLIRRKIIDRNLMR